MESTGAIEPKFIRFLTNDDTKSDELRLPKQTVRKYCDRLKPSFLLKFRNGYEIPVQLNEESWTLVGISAVYEDFTLIGGEMLVFEYNGSTDFNVYIIDSDMTEIEYPNIVHCSQKKRPRVVSMRNGGLKFVTFVNEDSHLEDEFAAPASFKRACPLLFAHQIFLFSNGKKTEGGYNHESGKFFRFKKFCEIVGIEDFSKFNLIMSSYEGNGQTTVSVYDDNFIEVMFPGTPLSPGCNSHNPPVRGRIEINVQPCHMYKYSYGVDIPRQFGGITISWKNRDYIYAYLGDKAWKLEVRTRRNQFQHCGILDGWIKFREDLDLAVGDVLVLECTNYSSHHFSVQVIKKPVA